jgi:hypothetical protein
MYLDPISAECYECFNKVVSPLGYHKERSVSHAVNILTKLTGGSSDIILHSRDRAYNTFVAYNKTGKGLSWEVWTMYSTHQNMFTEGLWAEGYAGSLSDSIVDERNIILFMDLRHDVVAYKKIRRVISLHNNGIDLPDFLPQNSEIPPDEPYYDFVKFPATTLTIVTTTSYHVEIGGKKYTFDESTTTENRSENIALSFTNNWTWGNIPDLNTPEYHLWEQYFLGVLPNPVADGYDYFEPFWQDEYLSCESDIIINELFRVGYGYTHSESEPTSQDFVTPYCDPSPQGSWAVDAKGNVFISQLAEGAVFNRLITSSGVESLPETIDEMEGENPVYFPVAPV